MSEANPKPQRVRGIVCFRCGGRLATYATRNPVRSRVVRYKKCLECGFRVTTDERGRPKNK